jgi:hypothetical protein
METKYNISTHTPLGDESFTIVFEHNAGSIITATGGFISGDKGTLRFANIRIGNDGESLNFSATTEVPFNVTLNFDAIFSNNESIINGRVAVGEYGNVDFFGSRD